MSGVGETDLWGLQRRERRGGRDSETGREPERGREKGERGWAGPFSKGL